MFGLGKKRSKYGAFLDLHGVKQKDICEESGLNRETVAKAFNEDNPELRSITKDALVRAASKLTNKTVRRDDFWM